MPSPIALSTQTADAIARAFETWEWDFRAVTSRARKRFAHGDWAGGQLDAVERLDQYSVAVGRIAADLKARIGAPLADRELWARAKAEFREWCRGSLVAELAETFFNSVVRRIFDTVGVDTETEFLEGDAEFGPGASAAEAQSFSAAKSTRSMVGEILAAHAFEVAYEQLDRDAARAGAAIDAHWAQAAGGAKLEHAEVADPVFFRRKGAYIIGKLAGGGVTIPFLLALSSTPSGVVVDAVLLTEDEVSVVFSFTRSYFHVELQRPAAMVQFLKSLMPRKPIAELYAALGFNKHGKTELYRDLLRHLGRSSERFEIAPGEQGLVMLVFTMPSYDVVFKVIRDRFTPPKTITRADVLAKYQLVHKHDRAGRLVDVQEFEHLAFARDRFEPAMLELLLGHAAETVRVVGDRVIIKHLYTERRVIPLNLYLREAEPALAHAAVLDYGHSIRDLAAMNVFPGDLLLKNFGVTRHGRVIFYDYDELCLLTDCVFRDMPRARDDDDEMRAEPWFYVGEHDIFPEEFLTFMGMLPEQREAFVQSHGELLTAEWWRRMERRHRAGEIIDIYPYPPQRRLG